jgi:hypothetical protein
MRSESIGDEDRIQNTDRKVEFVESTLQTPLLVLSECAQNPPDRFGFGVAGNLGIRRFVGLVAIELQVGSGHGSTVLLLGLTRRRHLIASIAQEAVTDVDMVSDDIYCQEKKL